MDKQQESPKNNNYFQISLQLIGAGFLLSKSYNLVSRIYPYFINRNQKEILNRYGENSYAFITGSTGGIGKELAIKLANLDQNILIHGRNTTKLENLKQQLIDINPNIDIKIFCLDLSKKIDFEKDIKQNEILNQSDISILINNVGITNVAAIEQTPSQDIDTIINTNLYPMTYLSKYFLENAQKRKEQSGIINISSLMANNSYGYLSLYTASKAFVNNFSASLQKEYQHGNNNKVNITCITPYYVSTNMTRGQKLDFYTVSSESMVQNVLNLFFQKRKFGCGHINHEIIDFVLQNMPFKQYFDSKKTEEMRKVAEQLEKIQILNEKRKLRKLKKKQNQDK